MGKTKKGARPVVMLMGFSVMFGFTSCFWPFEKENSYDRHWGQETVLEYVDRKGTIHFHVRYDIGTGSHADSLYAAEVKCFADGSVSTVNTNPDLFLRSAFFMKSAEYVKYFVKSSDSYILLSNDGNGWKDPVAVDGDYTISSLFPRKDTSVSYQELNEKIVRDTIGVNDSYSVRIGGGPVINDIMYNDTALVSVDKDEISACYLAVYDGIKWNFTWISTGFAMIEQWHEDDAKFIRWGNDYIPCVSASKFRYDLTGYLKYDVGTDSFSYAAFSEEYKKIFKVLSDYAICFSCPPVIASDGRVHFIQYKWGIFTASYVIYDPASATPETPVWEKKLF